MSVKNLKTLFLFEISFHLSSMGKNLENYPALFYIIIFLYNTSCIQTISSVNYYVTL